MIATLLATIAVVATAAFFRGLTGFGFSLLAALGLPLVPNVEIAIPLILLLELATAALMLRKAAAFRNNEWRGIDGIDMKVLLIGGLAGAATGVGVAAHLPQDAMRLAINIATAVAALAALVRHPPPWFAGRGAASVVGWQVGTLLAAVAAGGPLLVAWLMSSRMRPGQARGAMTLFFGVVAVPALLLRAAFGTLPIAAAGLALGLLPVAAIGVASGEFAFARMAPARWRLLVNASLVAVTAAGAVGALHLI